jgi:hypothetical protein
VPSPPSEQCGRPAARASRLAVRRSPYYRGRGGYRPTWKTSMARLLLIGSTAQFVPLVCDVLAQEGIPVTAAANTYEGLTLASMGRPGASRSDIAYLVIDHQGSGLVAEGSLHATGVSRWDWVLSRCSRAAVRRSLMASWRRWLMCAAPPADKYV